MMCKCHFLWRLGVCLSDSYFISPLLKYGQWETSTCAGKWPLPQKGVIGNPIKSKCHAGNCVSQCESSMQSSWSWIQGRGDVWHWSLAAIRLVLLSCALFLCRQLSFYVLGLILFLLFFYLFLSGFSYKQVTAGAVLIKLYAKSETNRNKVCYICGDDLCLEIEICWPIEVVDVKLEWSRMTRGWWKKGNYLFLFITDISFPFLISCLWKLCWFCAQLCSRCVRTYTSRAYIMQNQSF